jgi:cytochrome c5
LLRPKEKNVFRAPPLIALITIAVLVPLAAHAEQELSLKSVSVELPFGDRMFPDGPGSDLVNSNCLACHSAGMVLNQPAMSKASWRAEVEKMRTAYKAPIDPKDIHSIVDYLVSIEGAK